jgi:hypothetical protein
MTRLELQARHLIGELRRFLIAETAAFSRSKLSRTPAQVGLRVGRVALGRATLSEDDVLSCRKFEDGIARGAWPIEVWDARRQPTMTCFPERDYYEIPLGCLITMNFANVFVAGRCLSATAKALASARVIATALATGWAAGAIAACQATGRERSEAVRRIREEMMNDE